MKKKKTVEAKETGKKILKLAAIFALCELLYQGGIYLQERLRIMFDISFLSFSIVGGILLCIYAAMNRGFSREIPTKDMLKPSLSDEEKEIQLQKIAKSKEKAKKLLYYVIPILFTVMLDLIYLFYIMPILQETGI